MSQSARDWYWISSGKIQPRASLVTLLSILHLCHKHSNVYERSESESCSVVSDSLRPHGLYSPWNSPGQNTGVERKKKKKNTGVGSLFPSPGDLPNPGIEPRSPALQVDSLPAELSGKPRLCIIPLKGIKRDFPGSPQVKTLRSQCRGPGFKPWSGN